MNKRHLDNFLAAALAVHRRGYETLERDEIDNGFIKDVRAEMMHIDVDVAIQYLRELQQELNRDE